MNFHRGIIRILRGLADNSLEGWAPKASDLYRLQFERVVYVDKDGAISSTDGHRGPGTQAGAKRADSPPQVTEPTKRDAERPNDERDGVIDVEPTRANGFSPIDFLANSTSFAFGIPVSDQAKDKGPDQPSEFGGNNTSLLSMELMIYDDLMTDIGGSARFFDQNFRNSVLFGSTPPPSAPELTGFPEGTGFQTPGTMYE